MHTRLLGVIVLAFLAGCATGPGKQIQDLFSPGKGQASLDAGVKQYEDGDYADSAKSLNAALEQGLSDRQQVRARKYLAFISCASNRIAACREEFRKALAIDPSFELAAAESGHPIWGPVFRQVKSGR
ncbi:MAG: TssQ family T6SS-associated lipoprotein [Clostridia bacterium]